MSNIIVQLDLNTINQIAAGEVIEDPTSVVKELMENSIDAGSTHIVIKIKDGGKSYVEISDNGKGMSQEDMKICHLKHTTSKIKNIHDIPEVMTMGFRGEALASISSVAKMTVQSKRLEDEVGYEIQLANSVIVQEGYCAFQECGTRIIVEDLFYNVPARKSFLDNDKNTKITKYIVEMVHYLSMANTHVRFELYVDGERLFISPGTGNLRNLVAEIYNTQLAKELIEIDNEVYGVKVKGFISKPENCVGNRTKQTFFVNNRYVKMDVLSQSLKNAYNEYAVSSKHPVCILFLEMEPTSIDVNVHPKKISIRFKHNVFPVILSAVKEALHRNRSYPSITLTNNNNNNNSTNSSNNNNNGSSNLPLIPEQVPYQHPFARPTTSYETQQRLIEKDLEDLNEIDKSTYNENLLINNDSLPKNESHYTEQLELEELKDNYHYAFADYPNLNVSGQILNSYIIAEYQSGMLMIDQHAAHERILYERFRAAFDSNSIVSIEALIPETIELSISDYITVKSNLSFFKKYGFELEDFGTKTLIIRQYPSVFKEHQIRNIVLNMIEELLSLDPKSTVDDFINKKIIMRSCKSAIKANMKLNNFQMEALLNDLIKCENPYHCPHGRPIIVNMTTYEIEKSFNRVV